MRDALSIMDQAIASAPTVDGKPRLSAAEIRDLMGTVPNTVFEEILEHVARNEAAGVLTTANRLLDAGNSPAQIARQFVRYLRNCVVAKIANLTPESPDSELLQISPDERRRAARTSSLFTEEELTRFLQVMLRTFDDLGFRQEQRFHLELGMLKLVHMQRLLPMEQFLSQLPRPTTPQPARVLPPPRVAAKASIPCSSAESRASAPATEPSSIQANAQEMADPAPPSIKESAATHRDSSSPRPEAPPRQREGSTAAVTHPNTSIPAVDVVSALAADRTDEPRQTSPAIQGLSTAATEPSSVSPLTVPEAATPRDASTDLNFHLPQSPVASAWDDPLVTAPTYPTGEPEILPDPDPESTEPASDAAVPTTPQAAEVSLLQSAAVEALFAAKTHTSAAEQLSEATWTIAEGELRIQTSLSKAMVTTLFRPEVEAIVKVALRENGVIGLRLIFLPGAPQTKTAAPRKPRTGSAQAKALDHPTVQAAQRLFNAEVTNVVDLRRD